MTTLVSIRQRIGYLDRVRGLAIVLMVLDHILIFVSHDNVLRFTLTRAAMPLFFVIGGNLIRKWPSNRVFLIGIIGAALPAFVPWIDSPDVLFWYALFYVPIYLARKHNLLPWIILVSLTLATNFYMLHLGNSFWPFGLLAIMALGAMMPLDSFRWGNRLPKFLEWPGRHPLSIYVGHLLALQAFYLYLMTFWGKR